MGLNTTHNAWHGPYSLFMDWREKLAKECGFDLYSYEGFGGNNAWDKEIKSHKLFELFFHADNEGILTPAQCIMIADGLQEVINRYKGEDKRFIVLTEQFKLGCVNAWESEENLEFH